MDARLGPITSATLLARDLDAATEGYRCLGLTPRVRFVLAAREAGHLELPHAAGARGAWFGTADGEPWLRVIEAPGAPLVEPMRRHGWLALEVLVGDVDRLAARLGPPHWRVLGPPADLDVSPHIRACQVLGPCGELVYLTQVRADVPPFELPRTTAAVGGLFIAVLSTPDREATARAWEALAGRAAWRFDTRITVLNRALGRPLEARYPVAVLQFRGRCLLEIDEVHHGTQQATADQTPAGVHLVSILGPHPAQTGPRAPPPPSAALPRPGVLWRSPTGERVELLG